MLRWVLRHPRLADHVNPEAASRQYAQLVATYDRQLWWLRGLQERLRHRAVELLHLRAGHIVLDVGCGTGASFALLEKAVGGSGGIVGIEQSAEMLQRARERIESAGWRNVTLLQGRAEKVQNIGVVADAALFFFTHDILRTSFALEQSLRQVKLGGRVVAAGMKMTSRWAVPLNLGIWLAARRYVTTSEGFDRPWSYLEQLVPGLQVEVSDLGLAYVATGNRSLPSLSD